MTDLRVARAASLLHPCDLLDDEIRERRPLQQQRPSLGGRVAHHFEAFVHQFSHLLVFGAVQTHRLRRARIEPHAIHSLARHPRAADEVHGLQGLDGVGDGASARQERVGQLADALLRRVADRQVADQPADHRREGEAARIEAPHVVGEGDLGVCGHATQNSAMTEITQICVISVR
jgi:hypothetical protein